MGSRNTFPFQPPLSWANKQSTPPLLPPSHQILTGGHRSTFLYTLDVMGISGRYCTHVWSKLLIAIMNLRLGHIDWGQGIFLLPAMQTPHERLLPLSARLGSATAEFYAELSSGALDVKIKQTGRADQLRGLQTKFQSGEKCLHGPAYNRNADAHGFEQPPPMSPVFE